jgi:cytochrome c oxidase subunit 1/cytochrome c oxidase subunit I+III
MMDEKLGKLSFWVMFIGFNLGFFPMHNLGLLGMPRRIYTYQEGLGFGSLNMLVTIGAFILGIGMLISIVNVIQSLRVGRLAGRNPWNSDGMEWETESPPAPYGSAHIPVVTTRHPLWDDFEESEDPDFVRTVEFGRLTPTTTWLDSEPQAIATIPEDSLAPLVLAIVMFVFFITFTFQLIWIALACLIALFLIGCYWMWPRLSKEIL